ncbi:hypothetical protein ACQPWY_24075 [Pseudonocardia xinjiangensis]
MPTVTGIGLIAGVVAAILTGQWWLVAVGLVLGAGVGATVRPR